VSFVQTSAPETSDLPAARRQHRRPNKGAAADENAQLKVSEPGYSSACAFSRLSARRYAAWVLHATARASVGGYGQAAQLNRSPRPAARSCSSARLLGSPWLRRRTNRGCVVPGEIVLAARPQDAFLPRVSSPACRRPGRASCVKGHGSQVAHVPRVRWPRVIRRSPARVSRRLGGVLSSQPHNYSLQRISTRNSKVWYRVCSAPAR
jgi:hypothetical protein